MDAALHAVFRGAAFPGFAHAAADFVVVDEVGCAAQVLVRATLRECAEAALVQADVRVVDVANDRVADGVADRLRAQPIGGGADGDEVGATCAEQGRDFDFAEFAARSEEHTSELQSLMRISYAVFCLKKKKNTKSINDI